MPVYKIQISKAPYMTLTVNVPEGECVVVTALRRISEVNKKTRASYARSARSSNPGIAAYYKKRIPPEITLVKVLEKVEANGIYGKDQWGYFYKMTGLEAKGSCFWCGESTRGRYCCESHRLRYLCHFNWNMARDWCWRRYASQCGLCGAVAGDWSYRPLEVHHIEPLNSGFRDWTKLNRPENLILLCPPCHDSTRKKDFTGISVDSVDTNQLVMI